MLSHMGKFSPPSPPPARPQLSSLTPQLAPQMTQPITRGPSQPPEASAGPQQGPQSALQRPWSAPQRPHTQKFTPTINQGQLLSAVLSICNCALALTSSIYLYSLLQYQFDGLNVWVPLSCWLSNTQSTKANFSALSNL